ncbi:uncharacterized protein B0I36DRAFT_311921 [Microdochium trichocladiopsis]|uniref:DUF7907 domain-containing protein n=1 Tax=Microdochium trichocladiopsis TaxID=1682393 RepID=A0A9P8YIP5_9PEZI|nr:uncharacterized protein B0I36DRAFT_311921 [Microdochium trichocladiopsis]KAH7041000.1 hypothetical protein B0I36DRAFT_311921 [Microdochium trichocladiopsis]
MMRIATGLAALAFAFSGVVVAQQDADQSGPFYLHIKGSGSDLDGYVSACHAGAAIEGLCYSPGGKPTADKAASYEYYFNTTGSPQLDNGSPAGILFWRLPVQINPTTPFAEQPMTFQYSPNSNVAAPLFGFQDGTLVGFDKDDGNKLFTYAYVDSSTFQPGVQPTTGSYDYKSWFVCWQYFSGYYYQSVGFATTLPPNNPTCQAVEIVQEFVNY